MKIISYYCDIGDNTYYSDHAKRLDQDLSHFDLDYEIAELESFDNYRLNCLRKPKFILEKIKEYKQPILWLDVDSYVHRNLNIFDQFDNSDYDLIYATESPDWGPLKASPIYFPYKEKTLEIIESWVDDCNKCIESNHPFFDHEVLLWITLARYMEHPHERHKWYPENPIKVLALGREFCTWPQAFNPNGTVITMGISDGESKEQGLIELGVSDKGERDFQLIGKVDHLANVYCDGPYAVLVSHFPENFPHGNPQLLQYLPDIKYEAVLFDLDGVLVDACDWHYHSLNAALEEVIGRSISREEHKTTYNGLPTTVKLDMLGVSEEDKKKIWKLKQEKTKETIEKTASPQEDKIMLLKYLKYKGVKVGCVTNSIRETAELMLERTGILEFFDIVVTNEDVENNKPFPDCYDHAVGALGVDPTRTLIVEDSQKGIEAATSSGVSSIWEVSNATEVTLREFFSSKERR